MNKIFSKVWNARLGCIQVASELAGSPVSQSSSGASPAHRRGILVSGVLVALMSMFGASQAMAGDAVCADPVTGQASGTVTNSLGTSVACGNNAKADGVNAVVIGNNATGAGGANQIVIGNGAYATGTASTSASKTWVSTDGAVSVGSASGNVTRQITNLAAGTNATDAVNLAQLQATEVHYISVNSAAGGPNYANNGATGANAIAIGYGATSTAEGSFSSGYLSKATGARSTAIGTNANAEGENSISISAGGAGNIARGYGATSIGTFAIADGQNATAIGRSANAGVGSTSIGGLSSAKGSSAVAIGALTNAMDSSVSIGNGAGNGYANASSTIAIGSSAAAQSNGNSGYYIGRQAGYGANGNNNAVSGVNAYMFGIGNNNFVGGANAARYSSGSNNVMLGSGAGTNSSEATRKNYSNSVMIGDGANGNNNMTNSVAIGTGANGGNYGEIAIGNQAGTGRLTGDRNISMGDGAGRLNSGGANVAIGNDAATSITGNNNISLGANAGDRISGNDNITVGTNANTDATANQAIAIGENTKAVSRSTAMGANSKATGNQSLAIGDGAQAIGEQSISIGTGNAVYGNRSGAIGDPTIVESPDSYSIGNNNNIAAGQNDVFAFGNDITKTVSNSVALGSNAAMYAAKAVTGMTIRGTAYTYAGGAPVGVVSVGDVGKERQIQNVAAGQVTATSTDAINGSQLYATTTALENLVTSSGVKYFSVNSTGGTNEDNKGATGADAIAIGKNASSTVAGATAVGLNSKATGTNSISLGASTAAGADAIALGRTANGGGANSIAVGVNTNAGANSVAIGVGGATGSLATQATGQYSIAIGRVARAFNDNAIAIGQYSASTSNGVGIGWTAVADQDKSVAIGYNTYGGVQGVQVGVATTVFAGGFRGAFRRGSTLVGYNAESGGLYSTVMGSTSGIMTNQNIKGGGIGGVFGTFSTQGAFSNIFGAYNTVGKVTDTAVYNSIAVSVVGSANTVTESNGVFIGGYGNTVNKAYDSKLDLDFVTDSSSASIANLVKDPNTALGQVGVIGAGNTLDTANNTFVVGVKNKVDNSNLSQVSGFQQTASKINNSFIAGAASTYNNASSVVGMGTNQNVGTAANTAKNSILIGDNINYAQTTSQQDSIAIGNDTESATGAVAVGVTAKAKGDYSIAVGSQAIAGTVVAGGNKTNAVAIGNGAKALGDKSIAIGTGNVVSGDRSGAIGDPNSVTGNDSYAVGNSNTIAADGTFVLGNNVNAGSVGNSVALGNNSTLSVAVGVPGSTIAGTYHAYAGTSPVGTVSVGAAGAERQIQNVAAGRVSASSTDAINGSQLYAVQDAVGDVNERALKYDWNDANGNGVVDPGEVDYTVATLGEGGPATKLTNVAAGNVSGSSTDAVNGSQLFGTAQSVANHLGGGSVVNADGTVSAPSYSTSTGVYSDVGSALFAANAQTNALGNSVAIGLGGSSSYNPVTGSVTTALNVGGNAYSDVNTALSSINATASSGWNISANGGPSANVAPGGTVDVAGSGNITVSRTGTNLTVGMVSNPTFAGPVTFGSGFTVIPGGLVDMGGNRITNVGAGAAGTDAVNVDQLQSAINNVSSTTLTQVTANSPMTFQDTTNGKAVVRVYNTTTSAYGLYYADEIDASGQPVAGAATVAPGSVALSTIDPDSGRPIGAHQIRNVADGEVSASSTDAVNGSQLFDVNVTATNAANNAAGNTLALGGGASYDPVTGTYTAPSYVVSGGTYNDVGSALSAVDATANAGWDYTVNGAGSTNVGPRGKVDFSQADGNVVVSQTAAGVSVGLAPDLSVTSVNAGGSLLNGTGITLANGSSLTTGGLNVAPGSTVNMGGNVVSNVAAGEVSAISTDAVNGSQLFTTTQNVIAVQNSVNALGGSVASGLGGSSSYDPSTGQVTTSLSVGGNTYSDVNTALNSISATASSGWDLSTNGGSKHNVAPGTAVDLSNADGNIAVSNTDGNVQISLSKDVSVDSVNAGGSLLNGTGITLANGSSLTTGGLNVAPGSTVNMGGNVVSNVAAGEVSATSADAVNGSQLFTTTQNVIAVQNSVNTLGGSVASGLGGSSSYDPSTGQVTTSLSVGGNTYSDVNTALNTVNGTASAGWNLTGNGQGLTNVAPGETVDLNSVDGNIVITKDPASDSVSFGLAPDISVTSVNAGGSLLNGAGITLANGSSLTTGGLNVAPGSTVNMGGNVVSNVAAGEVSAISTDAVNGSQLHGVSVVSNNAANNATGNTVSLGGGASYDPVTGIYTSPLYNVGGGSWNNVGDALNALDAIAQIGGMGWTLTAQGSGGSTVKGGDVVDLSNTDGNIVVSKSDQSHDTAFNLAKNINVDSVTAGGNTLDQDGLTVRDASGGSALYGPSGMVLSNGTSLTRDGLTVAPGSSVNMGGNVISGVGAGVNGSDAVNVDQLNAVAANAQQGVTANNTAVKYEWIDANGDGIAQPSEINMTKVVLNPGGSATTVTNVANGDVSAGSTDAVNGSQLAAGLGGVASALGGGASVNADGSINGPSYSVGGNTYTDVGSALSAIGATAGAGWNLSTNGGAPSNVAPGATVDIGNKDGNITVTNDGTNVTVGLAKGITVDSVKVPAAGGGTAVTLDANGVAVTGGASVTKDGVNAGGKKITNVADGTEDSDAATVGQLRVAQNKSGVLYDDPNVGTSVTLNAGGAPAQIHNVQAGTVNTDAVNLGQLNAGLAKTLGDANAYTDIQMMGIRQDMGEMSRGYKSATASAMAMAGLPQAYIPGAKMAAVAVGGYQGQAGIAFGVSGITDNGKWVFKAQGSANSSGEVGFSVGAGRQW